MANPKSGVVIAFALLAVLGYAAAVTTPGQHADLLHIVRSDATLALQHFHEWAVNHSKPYVASAENNAEELMHRFKIWAENLAWIVEHNSHPGRTYQVGLTAMADLTQEEYRARYLGYDHAARKALKAASEPTPFQYADVAEADLPAEIDWRAQNAVTEVKNQQQCGSCWAFSTTGSVEGINAIVTKDLVSLSEQELVDCDTDQDNGCHGGLMDYAYQWIISNKGLDTEEDYPYKAIDGTCNERKKKRHVVTIDGFEDVPANSETNLKKAVANQPVSVAIEADQKAFQLYMGGVFNDETCGTELDHGVLVVGYGKDAKGGPYWIVKNSWGPEWGEKGYIRLKQGSSSKEGMCGIAMAASYPTKKGPNPPAPGPDPSPEPGPEPGPSPSPDVDCDTMSSCPAGTTCCCVSEFLNMCLQWGCCPMEDAICCEDKEHCCPPSLPVCDTKGGRCLPGAGIFEGAQPMLKKLPAERKPTAFDRLFKRGKPAA